MRRWHSGRNLLHSTVDGLHNDTGDLVRVGVGGGTTILEVTVALGGALAGNADRRATVGDAVGELVDGTRLVSAGETELVALAVDKDVYKLVISISACAMGFGGAQCHLRSL